MFLIRDASSCEDADFITAAFDSSLPFLTETGNTGQWGTLPFSQRDGFLEGTREDITQSEIFRLSGQGQRRRVFIAEIEETHSSSDVVNLHHRKDHHTGKTFVSVGAAMVLDDEFASHTRSVAVLDSHIAAAEKNGGFVFLDFLIADHHVPSARRKGAGLALLECVKAYASEHGKLAIFLDCWTGGTDKLVNCKNGYKQVGTQCVPDCGSDADWTGLYCKCKKSFLVYSSSSKSCACLWSYQEERDGQCKDICPGAIYRRSGPEKCVCPRTSLKFDYDDKKCCPVSGSKFKGDDSKGNLICECEDKYKKIDNGACVLKCPNNDEIFNKDGANGPVCDKKCPEEGTEFDSDSPNNKPICKCVKKSEKLGTNGKCSLKCIKPEEQWTSDTTEGVPVCEPKCSEKGTRFVKDGDKDTDPAVCECIAKSEKLDDSGKCVLKCSKKDEEWSEDNGDEPVCAKKCPKAGQQFVKDGDKKDDPPVCECIAKDEKLEDGVCKPKCEKPSEKWTEDNGDTPVCVKKCDKKDEKWDGDDDEKNPICKPKCPNSGQKWLSDGEKEDDPPICGCVKKEDKLDDGECKPKCTVDNTVFVKDGEDGEHPVCECDDEKNYLTEAGCKPKCPKDATFKKNGDEWTCDCPNIDEVFTKTTSDSGPRCACDSDEKHVKDGKCVPKCPTGATYHGDTDGYTCDCTAAIAGSDWDKEKNTCGCPAKNADNEKLTLNDAKDKCILDCGSEAKLSTNGDKCECNKSYGTKFDKTLLQCPCDAPDFRASNGVCVPDCGTQATLDSARTSCVCKKRGQKFTKSDKSCACDTPLVWSDGSCHMSCGKYANWDKSRKECVCQKRGQLFDDESSTCACPGKKIWDSSQCIPNCGDYATWNGRNKACICDKKGQVFTPSTSTCDCPDGEKWIGNKCTVDCGDEAQLDKRTGKCVCYKVGQTFDKVSMGCACPAATPEWSSRAKKCYKPKA
ncbi:hypothetical protein ACHAP7_001882 [Fusarium lateritium]